MTGRQSILIVGAGPSGLTAALELTRRGFSPSIIDQDEGPAVESRAAGINPRTLQILEPCGVTPRLLEAGNRVEKFYFRSPDKLLFTGDLSLLAKPYNFILLLPQSHTERIMIDRLAELDVEVERATRLVSIGDTGGPVAVTMQHPDGRNTEKHFDIVIGADGAHSTTRHAIGQAFKGSAYEHKWGLADAEVETDLPLDGINVIDRAPDLFAVFPLGGNHVRLVSDQDDIMAHLPPEIRVIKTIWVTPFKISHRLVESYQSGQVFLVGDAAHIHSPFGGRGMNMGIEDAAWLSWLIDQGGTEGYTQARRPVATQVIEVTDLATRFMASDGPVEKFLRRQIVPKVASWPFVQRRILPNVSASNTPFPPWLDTNGPS